MMNDSSSSGNGVLIIERFECVYLVPQEHPAPERLRAQMDTVLRKRIAAVCSQVLSRVLNANDPSVWLIRNLDLDLTLGIAAADDDLLAEAWSNRIAAAVAKTIAQGADGETVLRFPNRAAYLAQFISDLAEGKARGNWCYNQLDTLGSLPASAAIAEALVRERDQTQAVLLILAERGRLDQALDTMSEGDVRRVFLSCFDFSAPSDDANHRHIEGLISIWPTALLSYSQSQIASARNAVRLYVQLRQRLPDLSNDSQMYEAIIHLLGLAELLRATQAAKPLVDLLAAGDLRKATELVRACGLTAHLESLAFATRVASADGDLVRRIASAVAPAIRAETTQKHRSEAQTFITPFGGVFILLSSLLDSGLYRVIEAAPYRDLDGIIKSKALLYLLMLKCLGRSQAIVASCDPAVGLAAGLEELPSFDDLQRFIEDCSEAADRASMRTLIESLAYDRRIEGRCLSADLVSLPALDRKVLLVTDVCYDVWVFASCVTTDDPLEIEASLSHAISIIGASVGAPPESLLLGRGIGGLIQVNRIQGWKGLVLWVEKDQAPQAAPVGLNLSSASNPLTVWTTETGALAEDLRFSLERYLMRSKPVERELNYFTLINIAGSFAINAHFDITWSLFARAVLKNFASRLMGFGWSSAEYIYLNFLAGTSMVMVEGDRIDVELSRAPLQIIMRMAGVDGQNYRLPWLNDAQVRLSLMIS